MGDKSSAEIARLMFDTINPNLRRQIKRDDAERLLAHDPSKPISSAYAMVEDYNVTIHINFSGNCVRASGRQTWIGADGNIIEVPRGLTTSWAIEQAEKLVADLQALGKTARLSHSGKHKHPKEPGDITVLVPDHVRLGTRAHLNRPPGVIDTHYLVIHTLMQDITGTIRQRTFRTDSIGREDIAQGIIEHIEKLEAAMPKNPDEALAIGRAKVEEVIRKAFDAHLIEPIIHSIEQDTRTNGIAFDVTHTMHDTLLRPKKTRDHIVFYGDRPEDPWRASCGALGTGLAHGNLAAEASRRANIEANGGLTQTSLTRKIIELAKLDAIPIDTEYNGSAKKTRFRLISTPPTDGTIQVKNGRLETSMKIGDTITVTTGTVKIDNNVELPEAAIQSMKGRKLNTVIDHPAIDDDVIITSAQLKGGSLHARIRMETVPVVTEEAENSDEHHS